MTSPFPASSSSPGGGRLVVRRIPDGASCLESMSYQYPLKLISPTPSGYQKCVLVFLLSYGGGLVGGDLVDLCIHVQREAKLSLVTQGHTKIFKSPSPSVVTRQTLRIQLDDDSALCLLPDPVQPFENSVYEQIQIFTTKKSSSLCFLDWVTQGRKARGEDWSFFKWTGRNEVWLQGADATERNRLLVRDTVVLSADGAKSTRQTLKQSMHGIAVCGTLLLRGPLMESLGEFFQSEFATLPRLGAREFRSPGTNSESDENGATLTAWRSRRLAMEKEQGILWSAAHVRGCVVVKFAAPTVESGRDWIGSMLQMEGSIREHFGDEAIMCVR